MAWPTVNLSEITDRFLQTLTSDQTRVATKRLADAQAILQYHLRTRGVLEAPADDAWATLYTQIVADMVVRLLSNPEGWVEQTIAVDDYRNTLRRAGDTAPSTLYVDEAELGRLLPIERRARRAFTIRGGYA